MGESWIPPGWDTVKALAGLGTVGYRLREQVLAAGGVQRRRLDRQLRQLLQAPVLTAAGGGPAPGGRVASEADELTEALLDSVAVLAAGEHEHAAAVLAGEVLMGRLRRKAAEEVARRFAVLKARVDAGRPPSPPPPPSPPLVAAAVPAPVVVPVRSGPRVRKLSAAPPVRGLSPAAAVRRLSAPSRVRR